uniref:Zinc finger and BTB domain-containing protein 41 n=1 Tax=Nothobranchius pienaari TaxID=704102 RepID=A0A1A8LG20_9TELE
MSHRLGENDSAEASFTSEHRLLKTTATPVKKEPNTMSCPRRRSFVCEPDPAPEAGSRAVQESPLRRLTMSHHSHNLLAFLNEDRTRQKFCDVSVSVGGKAYSAHKAVLAHGSSYFHAELSKSSATTTHVTLDHVEASVFQHLLGFLYTAECIVAETDLPALAEAARFLDMMDILKLLCDDGETSAVQAGTSTYTDVDPSSTDPAGADPEIHSSSDVKCPQVTHQFSPQHSLCERTDLPGEVSNEEESRSGQKNESTRRSARRRRTKCKREDLKHWTQEQQRASLLRLKDKNNAEEATELFEENQEPKLDESVTTKAVKGDNMMDEDGEDVERGDVVNLKVAEVSGSDGSHAETTERQAELEGHAPAAGSSSQTPVYPEGLEPVIIQTSSKKTLQCPKCGKTFDRTGKYESHTRVHTGEKPFQCDICLQCYSTKSNLTVHKKKHASDAPFPKKEHKCPFCHKLHASRKTLAKHVKRFHPEQTQEFLAARKKRSEGWKCAICSKTFSRRPHLQEHMILHTQDRPFKCSSCDEFFRSRFARLKHQEKYHLGPFPCEICGRQFNDTGNRKRHIECTHGGKRKWTCFVCGKSVRERTTLREHLRIHSGEKPHLCSICGQSFRHSSSYRLHLRVHHDDKRYECDECGKTFIRHDHLTKHQIIHSGEKAHQCEECGKCFRRQDHLTVHYKSVHLGEKIWQKYKTAVHQCEVCKKEFKGRSSLEMHFRTHSGEKPHKCPECHQTFRIKKTLTKHMVIHSDARPFNCPHCSATFKRKDKLKYHVDHVHSVRLAEPPPRQDEVISVPFEDASNSFTTDPKSAPQSSSDPTNVCVPVTLVSVPMAGGEQGNHRTGSHSSQTQGVVNMQAHGPQQNSAYQAATDLAFLEKYTLTPQPANIVHPVRSDQILDPREQSYLGTLLGLDSASSVQTSSDHTH